MKTLSKKMALIKSAPWYNIHMQLCTICNRSENETPFGKDKRCLECNRKRAKLLYKKFVDIRRKKALTKYWANRDSILDKNKKRELAIKDDVFNGYGGYICVCCGEKEKVFLTIDHINGGGIEHRRNISGGAKGIYRWLRKNNYPKGFRVLCYNCNCGRSRNNGICPHEKK